MEGAKEAYRGTAPVSALCRRQNINLAVSKNRENKLQINTGIGEVEQRAEKFEFLM
jgi:hypothetical protein